MKRKVMLLKCLNYQSLVRLSGLLTMNEDVSNDICFKYDVHI